MARPPPRRCYDDFVKQGREPRGITCTETWKSSKIKFHVAVSTALAKDFPTLPSLLRSIAALPSSCLNFYQTEKRLCKVLKRSTRGQSEGARMKTFQRARILSKPIEWEDAEKSTKSCTYTRAVLCCAGSKPSAPAARSARRKLISLGAAGVVNLTEYY